MINPTLGFLAFVWLYSNHCKTEWVLTCRGEQKDEEHNSQSQKKKYIYKTTTEILSSSRGSSHNIK